METTVDGSGRVFPIVQGTEIHTTGLTKRELFAAMAMQGLMADSNVEDPIAASQLAVRCADALINELNEKQ